MRTSIYVRTGAVLTATTLALSLGLSAASADSSSRSQHAEQATATATGRTSTLLTPAASAAPAALSVSKFRLHSGVITSRTVTGIYGDVLLGGTGSGKSAVTEVRVNGAYKGKVTLYVGPYKKTGNTVSGGGINLPRGWGAGKVQVGPTTFTYTDGTTTTDPTKSNIFYARKNIKTTRADKIALKIKRVNRKITFKAQQIRVINPSNGKYVSVGKVKLQYKSGSTWKTKKVIKLNSKGDGSYSRKTSSKYRYRLYISQTSKSVEFRTYQSKKI